MLSLLFLVHILASCCSSLQTKLISCEQPSNQALTFSKRWMSLGPFQIGTREASWQADPLEVHGGFPQIPIDEETIFRSSLAPNASVKWMIDLHDTVVESPTSANVRLHTEYPDIDWEFQQKVYGWSALQYQSWTRGYLFNHGSCTQRALLWPRGILEFVLNGQHFFGGDFYVFDRCPILIELVPGRNKIDIRLIRDVRASGGQSPPTIDAELRCELVSEGVRVDHPHIIAPDLVNGKLPSSYFSVPVTNLYRQVIIITGCEHGASRDQLNLVYSEPIRIIPGQTRPVAYRLQVEPASGLIQSAICFQYEKEETPSDVRLVDLLYQLTYRRLDEAHKFTFLHPSGVVSYAVLKPPHHRPTPNASLPLMLVLHGAGLEADSDQVRHSLDEIPDLPTFALFPTGMSPWSSDDWHIWGLADILAAIDAVHGWTARMDWNGTSVTTEQVLVIGHSNGGQGTWFFATHLPDRTLAAAPISGYTSIENYVPYNFWTEASPIKQAVVNMARASFKHEVLLENVADIPILVQHGSADDNVPPYHSRLMSDLLARFGSKFDYVELANKGHWFDGAITTQPLQEFYSTYLSCPATKRNMSRQFSVTSLATQEMGPKNGVSIEQLHTPNSYGRLDVRTEIDGQITWYIQSSNIRRFKVNLDASPLSPKKPRYFKIDFTSISFGSSTGEICFDQALDGSWSQQYCSARESERAGRQRGTMDALMRTIAPFQIIAEEIHTPLALQISRNLVQYFGADSIIKNFGQKAEALASGGNVISLTTSRSMSALAPLMSSFPITFDDVGIKLCPQQSRCRRIAYDTVAGIITLRPLGNERLEALVWGPDLAGLQAAARLLPTLSGVGQPDFVILGPTSKWQGLEGALALGFFDYSWNISQFSYY